MWTCAKASALICKVKSKLIRSECFISRCVKHKLGLLLLVVPRLGDSDASWKR